MTRKPAHTLDGSFERRCMDAGRGPVAGVDEAGRGPLAGPVVAAAVILDLAAVPAGLDDSKALSEEQRQRLFEQIVASSTVAWASISPRTIDDTDIRKATLRAMGNAVAALSTRPQLVLVDGRDRCPIPEGSACEAVIGGDAQIASIAAASIVAKVVRDGLMAELDKAIPGYGLAGHKGYGTVAHREAIIALGPSLDHRLTFGIAREIAAARGIRRP